MTNVTSHSCSRVSEKARERERERPFLEASLLSVSVKENCATHVRHIESHVDWLEELVSERNEEKQRMRERDQRKRVRECGRERNRVTHEKKQASKFAEEELEDSLCLLEACGQVRKFLLTSFSFLVVVVVVVVSYTLHLTL